MPGDMSAATAVLGQIDVTYWLVNTVAFLKVVIGFSLIILVHELGHFWVAKWCGVRVDKFAIGFGPRLFGWRRGQGFTTGTDTHITPEEVTSRGWGESDYCINALPFGGYVKMLGEDDILINEDTGEMKLSEDPRAFPNRPVGQRMLIVSAGVVFNIIFAALLYVLVFMIGHELPAPIVGTLDPTKPAAQAGLMSGDHIIELNGSPVKSFNEVALAGVLNREIRVRVERNGQPLDELFIIPTVWDDNRKLRESGITPSIKLVCGRDLPDTSAGPGLRKGDTILEINGEPASGDILHGSKTEHFSSAPLEMKVERVDAEGTTSIATAYYSPRVIMLPLTPPNASESQRSDRWSYFGLQPRLTAMYLEPGYPAEQAGMKVDDVLMQWGTITNPTYYDVVDTNQAHAGKTFPIQIYRPATQEVLDLEITPTTPSLLAGEDQAKVGVSFFPESDLAVVANLLDSGAASDLALPRGARITAVADVPVVSWIDVLAQFDLHAGEPVSLTYEAGTNTGQVEFKVPSSLYHALNISRNSRIVSINGQKEYKISENEVWRLPNALQAMLMSHEGETVTVEYRLPGEDDSTHTAEMLVTANNTDPWPARALFGFDFPTSNDIRMVMVQAGNPIEAAWMGVTEVSNNVLMVYQTLQKLLEAEVSVRHVSGPVGVINQGIKVARTSYTQLLLFLAVLSINLAVINFLPFPVVDGGVMIFLIIEKIKGSPISLKVQMTTTIVGLSIILLGFVLVTFKDVWSLFLR
jgi:regulator of sigma E protease